MKTVCEKCSAIIDTKGVLKGQRAFYFNIQIDTEPHINTAYPIDQEGYLCFDCSQKIKLALNLNN